jgi:hypothetical protein
MKKIAGLIAGLSAVAAVGVAIAQSVPPNPFVTNHALGAGQQNAHLAPMGETGTPWPSTEVRTAAIAQPAPVAAAPVVEQQVAQAPAPQEMGAAPAPVQEEPAPMRPAPRHDRG